MQASPEGATVNSEPARYDAIADWYVEFTKDWDSEPLALLPGDLRGQRVLDLACGYGTASRYLAQRGARVTGVDISAGLLSRAQQLEAGQQLGIGYIQGDATATGWWDGVAYNGVLCNMALMDIDDLDGALSTVAAVLAPAGWFSFSVFHPCYPGGREGSLSGLPSWPPDGGYACEGRWSTGGEGVRGRAGANHRTLSTYLNAVLRAGFVVEELAERGSSVPVVLIARCRHQAA
jgi:SAM-dependent methyltransferase